MKDGIVNCISAEPLQVVITLSCYTSVFVDIGGLLVLGFDGSATPFAFDTVFQFMSHHSCLGLWPCRLVQS
jgi:hypothetical protein